VAAEVERILDGMSSLERAPTLKDLAGLPRVFQARRVGAAEVRPVSS
jgi:hypothetical protein